MRISDWSSDVCSSDLIRPNHLKIDKPQNKSRADSLEILRQHAELFLETCRKVGWRIQPYQITDFTNPIILRPEQLCRFFQAYQPDGIGGSQLSYLFNLAVKSRAINIQCIRQVVKV